MHVSGGLGFETANWITKGSPSVDMFGYDVKRFPVSLVQNEQWLREKCHETMVRQLFRFTQGRNHRVAVLFFKGYILLSAAAKYFANSCNILL